MTNFKKLKPRYDRKFAEDGIWVYAVDEVGNEYGGFRVGLYNISFPRIAASKAKLDRLINQSNKNRRGADAKEAETRLKVTHFIESCLVDWDMTDDKGKAIPFTPETAVEYFMLSEEHDGEKVYLHDYAFAAISEVARDVTRFQSDEQNEAGDPLKN